MWRISESGRIDALVVFRFERDVYAPVGTLTFEGSGPRRIGRFAYARSYLAAKSRKPIDPIGLPLVARSKPSAPEEVHLAFHDVGPDGWGKGIFERAFPMRRLGMPEFLALGGLARTGNLAFGPDHHAPATWAPDDVPLVTLPSIDDDVEALLAAADAVDQGSGTRAHLALLMRASADVGGARPKARLRYQGADWIAKFPTWSDRFDDPRVEAVCLDVAEAAGIEVPQRQLLDIAKKSVLLVRRFDRSAMGEPYAYLSAGTLLQTPSTEYGQTRKTYVDIAAAARSIGVPHPEPDLFRRLLVNSHLHNTDDHLRNHAVIDRGDGWRLSPAFGIVPHPGVARHVCGPAPSVSPEWNPHLAFGAHAAFGLGATEAGLIRDQVIEAVHRLPAFMAAREVRKVDADIVASALPAWFGRQASSGA